MNLTHEQIDALEPGRELDAAVAEHVMGWTDMQRGQVGRDTFQWFGICPAMPTSRIVPQNYSDGTDMNATWAVVEKMNVQGWRLHLTGNIRDEWQTYFVCPVLNDKRGKIVLDAIAARGVCRAALHALLDAQEGEGMIPPYSRTRKRVWKPLDVGGLRLYRVVITWPGEGNNKREKIVAAKSPTHAADLVKQEWQRVTYHAPDFKGYALNVLMPADWWDNGVPGTHDPL